MPTHPGLAPGLPDEAMLQPGLTVFTPGLHVPGWSQAFVTDAAWNCGVSLKLGLGVLVLAWYPRLATSAQQGPHGCQTTDHRT